MNSWTQYLHREHTASELKDWAQRLRWFRFCRAFGGHANDGDQLVVALQYTDQRDLDAIWTALGGLQPNSSRVEIGGVLVAFTRLKDRVLLSVFGSAGDAYQVTEQDIHNAQLVEQFLDTLQPRLIDPPVDDHHCVAPKFYPEFWKP